MVHAGRLQGARCVARGTDADGARGGSIGYGGGLGAVIGEGCAGAGGGVESIGAEICEDGGLDGDACDRRGDVSGDAARRRVAVRGSSEGVSVTAGFRFHRRHARILPWNGGGC